MLDHDGRNLLINFYLLERDPKAQGEILFELAMKDVWRNDYLLRYVQSNYPEQSALIDFNTVGIVGA